LSSSWVFDQAHYDSLNAARSSTVQCILPDLKQRLGLKTALDLGCGLGHYAGLLHNLGLEVHAVDGRRENVEEARRRYPQITFEVADAQDPELIRVGKYDLVFCFGLLYHLEDPFRVVRNIAALAGRLALVEGMVYPSAEPVMTLMDEHQLGDQGLNNVAFYPSEACLVKMLRRAGLENCYTPKQSPEHSDYRAGASGFRQRTMLAAAATPIEAPVLDAWPEPSPMFRPWAMMPLFPARGRTAKFYSVMDRLLNGEKRKRDRP
jgi:SAM-dependent methyltransferase